MIRTCDLLVPNEVAFAYRKNKERITAVRQGVFEIVPVLLVGVNRSFRSFLGETNGERKTVVEGHLLRRCCSLFAWQCDEHFPRA